MLCTLSWTSFALKSQFIEARLASTITLVLALMALSQVITPSLPPEQTKAHNFMFISNIFIVITGIESVVVCEWCIVAATLHALSLLRAQFS